MVENVADEHSQTPNQVRIHLELAILISGCMLMADTQPFKFFKICARKRKITNSIKTHYRTNYCKHVNIFERINI